MSDGVFDPTVSLDDLSDVRNITSDIDLSFDTNKEYWILGILILFIIGYYLYDNFNTLEDINNSKKSKKSKKN